MILLLKKWIVDNSFMGLTKEKYGDESCECLDNKILLGIEYVEIMQCYTFATDVNPEPYNCLTEAELTTVIDKSKAITVSRC